MIGRAYWIGALGEERDMRLTIGLLAAVCCLLGGLDAAAAQTGKRVALVIGNARYEHIPPLPNVPNDAKVMAALFEAARFDSVVVLHDQRVAELRRERLDFAERAAGADMAVVFYAGHGIEVDRVNYLIPVDARLNSDLAVKDETVSLDRLLELMEPARRLRVAIIDACRENPFVKSMRLTTATRSVTRGLGRVEAGGANTLIAFATEPNAVAADGSGRNSPFTAALVKHLATPGLDLRIALGNVRDEVMASTGAKQKPYVTSSLGGGVISLALGDAAPKPAVAAPSAQPQAADIAQAWAAAKDSTSMAVLEAFRLEYGSRSAFYDRLAEARIADLKKQQVALAAPPKPAPRPEMAAFNPKRATGPLTAAEERALKPRDSFKECAECPEVVVVPTGSFTMGSPQAEAGTSTGEGPQRQVTIARPFAAGKFEVTFAEWDACVAERGCKQQPDHGWGRTRQPMMPVMMVSWNDVTQQYLPWLSRKTGKTYRLLTEAEWEYVARAGTTTPFWWGASISTSQANYDGQPYAGGPKGENRSETVPVGSFPPNPWGLYDVHGNVWEWVQDCWNGNYNGAPSDGTARTTGDCATRIRRGGSWFEGPVDLRSANRGRAGTGFQ